jgi:hypothetical protein
LLMTEIDPNSVIPAGSDPAIVEALETIEKAEAAVSELQTRLAARGVELNEAITKSELAALLAESGSPEGDAIYRNTVELSLNLGDGRGQAAAA